MAQPIIQHSFHAGEWAPQLNARVDLQKYRSGAALMKNFFVDYRGGASSRYGTRFVNKCKRLDPSFPVRLIPFQASFKVTYVMEFGEFYVRFYHNAAPVLEDSFAITGATSTNPVVVTIPGHNYVVGDWVFISGVTGMFLNGRYYLITATTATTITLANSITAVPVDGTVLGTYTGGGSTNRVYEIPSPYAAADLALLKFAQNVDTMIFTHPNYAPTALTFIAPTNWTFTTIDFSTKTPTPTGVTATTTAAGTINVSYIVSAVSSDGEESGPSVVASSTIAPTTQGTITVNWSPVAGADSYNIYRSMTSTAGVPPPGSAFGFVTNVRGTSFQDMFSQGLSANQADFSQTPQLIRNPFLGASITSIDVTSSPTYSVVPAVSITPGPVPAVGQAVMSANTVVITGPSKFYNNGQTLTFGDSGLGGVVLVVTSTGPHPITGQPGNITGVAFVNKGHLLSGIVTTNVIPDQIGSNPADIGKPFFQFTWVVSDVQLSNSGAGYTSVPTVTFSPAGATAVATIGSASAGNPSVVSFHDQRMVLAAPPGNPQQMNFSQPGSYYNFNISDPVQEDDAIEVSLVSGRLNSIKSLISMPSGLITLSDRQVWLVNGGANAEAVSPINIVAHAQSYTGANDVPPIVANYDILFVQSKNSIVRSVTYDFYKNIYAGVDISILSSHLFFNFEVLEWAWAEEPYKIVWAVRNDGILLSCTYLKEQELIGWAQHETDGKFLSICSVTETIPDGAVDAVYVVVERVVMGGVTVKYVERFVDRYPKSYNDTSIWCVDSALQYSGPPVSFLFGLDHLIGKYVTGLADGAVVPPQLVPEAGSIVLSAPASVVTLGLPYTCQLQTLAIDTGDPTIQSKMKKVPAVTIRCQEALGLQIGSEQGTVVNMKDLQLGAIGSMSNDVVTDLVTSDVRTRLDPTYTVFGQYFIQQPLPYPATVLGVMPELAVGDTPK